MRLLLSSILAAPIVFLLFVVMAALVNSSGAFSSHTIICYFGTASPTFSLSINETDCIDCGRILHLPPRYLPSNDTPMLEVTSVDSINIISNNDLINNIDLQCREKDAKCHISEMFL